MMEMYTASSARANLFSLIKKVNIEHCPIHITAKDGDVVVISEKDWRAIEETLYLNSVPGLVDSVMRGLKEPCEKMIPEEEIDWENIDV